MTTERIIRFISLVQEDENAYLSINDIVETTLPDDRKKAYLLVKKWIKSLRWKVSHYPGKKEIRLQVLRHHSEESHSFVEVKDETLVKQFGRHGCIDTVHDLLHQEKTS